jgi:uncharacterized membrane protein (UPF0127 family)
MAMSWSSASTSEGSWLTSGDRVLASLEIARTRRHRVVGLLGRDGIDGALALPGVRSVHTFGMRFPIDVAFCDAEGRVLALRTLPPRRVTRPVRRAAVAIETEAGSFSRWGIGLGDRLEFR